MQAQKFLAAHDQINTIFRLYRYKLSAISHHHARAEAFDLWIGYKREMAA
jgi:putative transposase